MFQGLRGGGAGGRMKLYLATAVTAVARSPNWQTGG